MRNSEERGLLKRVYNFANRSQNNEKLLEPVTEDVMGDSDDYQNDLSPEFIETMIKIIPYVLSKKVSQLTMRELSVEAGIDVKELYALITNNIFKNPRPLLLAIKLKHAKELMDNNPYRTVEDIARECGFVSPNYFIAAFYRTYQMTPSEYCHKR
jgi:AraC-like DNA-binding protein